MAFNSSPLSIGILRGTIFFALLLLFEVFWGTVMEPNGPVLTATNVIMAGFAAASFVIVMHFLDKKRDRSS